MAADHVIGEDFELRLGIGLRAGRKQQRLEKLMRVRFDGPFAYEDSALIYRTPSPPNHALEKLPAGRMRFRVIHHGGDVGDSGVQHRDIVQPRMRGRCIEPHIDIQPRQARTERCIKRVVFGVAVTWIAVFEGYDAPPTAEGVSRATTRTVVTSSLAILALDFMLTALMFTGGKAG